MTIGYLNGRVRKKERSRNLTNDTRHIAVIGGGTAGWLTALMLKRNFESARTSGPSIRITLIESPKIPTVGVGEGSTSIFREVLLSLNIAEEDFLRETGATIKYGIKHAGWRPDGNDYFGPIDDPHQLVPRPNGVQENWLQFQRISSRKSASEAHLFHWLMKAKKAPYALRRDGKSISVSPYHYAYHFDQAKLGKFLAARSNGIHHIQDEVLDVEQNPETGEISSLLLETLGNFDADFFIDCTGFRRALISKLDATWQAYDEILPINTAMPFWLENDPSVEISPYTLARAMNAGWLWCIPTQDRLGCGYVFDSRHISPEEAHNELQDYLRQDIEIRRVISIDPGRLQQAWVANCVATGLAQSFLEPLEATSIHGTIIQVAVLGEVLSKVFRHGRVETARAKYNHFARQQVDDYAEFINLHYAGGRTDTSFWRWMTESGISDANRSRIQAWKSKPVTSDDFASLPNGLPHVEEQLHIPVLDGLGLLSSHTYQDYFRQRQGLKRIARQTSEKLIREYKSAVRQAMTHKEFLMSVSTG